MADLEQKFQQAAKDVNNLLTRPTDDILLMIYGLYKQATVGDVNIPKPGMFSPKDRAKYEAWLAKKGTSQEAAKQQYIDEVQKLVEKLGLK